jgi:mismatch-specific thymine-DNA glycosylase
LRSTKHVSGPLSGEISHLVVFDARLNNIGVLEISRRIWCYDLVLLYCDGCEIVRPNSPGSRHEPGAASTTPLSGAGINHQTDTFLSISSPCPLSTCPNPYLLIECYVARDLDMSRTRGAKSAEENVTILSNANPSDSIGNTDESDVEAEDSGADQATPSFNGKLQQFQYTSVTSTATTVTSSSRTIVSQTRASSKRKQLSGNHDNSAVQSPSPAKKKRQSSTYAPPSKYAHLSPLTDILEPNLICVFVGFNPGVRTATSGHAYAHPSNLFWKLLHSSGLTDRRCSPSEDVNLPRLYSMGNTNIVSRPSKDVAELSKQEVVDGTPILDRKMRIYRPEAVCIVGKSIWEAIWQYHYGKKPSKTEFSYGWQDERHNMGLLPVEGEEEGDDGWGGTRVFVATSTSGLAAYPRPAEKEAIWKPFGEWVQRRREERAKVKDESDLS